MDPDKKYELITQNLQEVVGNEVIMKKIIAQRPLRIYWGTSPTGRVHVGYFVPLLKIADFLKAGCEVKILIADLHAYLDSMKSSWELLSYRVDYYIKIIKEILQTLNVDIERLTFVKGTDFQLTSKYVIDMHKLDVITNLKTAVHAGAEVVKQSESPAIASIHYPILQALDEEYLDVDAQFGGIDQRKIFMYAREYLPKIKYKKRFHLMNPMVPPLSKTPLASTDPVLRKMSASSNLKIDVLDSAKDIRKKINCAFCEPGNTEDNTPLTLLRTMLFPVLHHRGEDFIIAKKEKYGPSITYTNYKDVENDYKTLKLHPGDLKNGISQNLCRLLDLIKQNFKSKEHAELLKKAYNQL